MTDTSPGDPEPLLPAPLTPLSDSFRMDAPVPSCASTRKPSRVHEAISVLLYRTVK